MNCFRKNAIKILICPFSPFMIQPKLSLEFFIKKLLITQLHMEMEKNSG